MKTIYIVVLDYCCGCIKTYEHDFPADVQNETIKSWLEEKTDFKDDQCYYMWDWEPIPTIEGVTND